MRNMRLARFAIVGLVAVTLTGLSTTAAFAGKDEPNGSAHAVPPGTPRSHVNAAPPGYPVTGIDVSNHQGTINWANVAAAGAKFETPQIAWRPDLKG